MAQPERRNEKTGAKQIAEVLQLSEPFLAKVLQQLARWGLVSSTKGPNGGFYLSEANLELPLLHIVERIDGLSELQACIMDLPTCSAHNPCPFHHLYKGFRGQLMEKLSTKTIGTWVVTEELALETLL